MQFLRVVGGSAEPGDEFELIGIVIGGAFEGDAVGGVLGEGWTEAGGLEVGVFGSVGFAWGEDADKEGAGVIGGIEEAVNAWVYGELRSVVGDANAVEGFVVLRIGFSNGGVIDFGGCEQIAFVGSVDEYVTAEDFAVGGTECEDAIILFEDRLGFVQRGCAKDGEIVFGDDAFEEEFGDVRFGAPDGVGAG